MPNNFVDLDSKIKTRFKLFSGVRPADEDQKIYDKVYNLCFDEMVLFLSEQLQDSEQDQLSEELNKQTTDDAKTKVLVNHLSKIDNYRFKLDHRLDSFLSNLLLSSLSRVKN